MAVIAVAGHEKAILRRWTDFARSAGHECTALIPGEKRESSSLICLFDLGPAGGADPEKLIASVVAQRQVSFIAMTAHPNIAEGLALLRAGVKGYCNRLANMAVLNALVGTVDHGEIWAGKQITDYLLQASLGEPADSHVPAKDVFADLTERELQVAHQVAAGLSNKVIAADAAITERTVKAHLNNIYRKTGIRNRVQLALAIAQNGRSGRRRSLA